MRKIGVWVGALSTAACYHATTEPGAPPSATVPAVVASEPARAPDGPLYVVDGTILDDAGAYPRPAQAGVSHEAGNPRPSSVALYVVDGTVVSDANGNLEPSPKASTPPAGAAAGRSSP